jgi:hypothetical protein
LGFGFQFGELGFGFRQIGSLGGEAGAGFGEFRDRYIMFAGGALEGVNAVVDGFQISFGLDTTGGTGDVVGGVLVSQATLLAADVDVRVVGTRSPRVCADGSAPDADPGAAYNYTVLVTPRAPPPTLGNRTVVPVRLDLGPGVISASYVPAVAGTYALSTLALVDWSTYAHVVGSPSRVDVRAGTIDGRASSVVGHGLAPDAGGAVTGTSHVAFVTLRDASGNAVVLEREQWCPDGECLGLRGSLPAVTKVHALPSGTTQLPTAQPGLQRLDAHTASGLVLGAALGQPSAVPAQEVCATGPVTSESCLSRLSALQASHLWLCNYRAPVPRVARRAQAVVPLPLLSTSPRRTLRV